MVLFVNKISTSERHIFTESYQIIHRKALSFPQNYPHIVHKNTQN